ncbi:MAG: NAD(P) transhydrogenase subunit alpha [Cyanothece sp. SIO1E1]|nr:NAD(P) transhydrogenase subunit alpha [Cyanothece sp. SIO1E1]
MTSEFLATLFIFVVSAFIGFEMVEKVLPMLHTPLVPGSNAISGVVSHDAPTLTPHP